MSDSSTGFVLPNAALRLKMDEWVENGAALAWLLEPAERRVTIYRPDRAAEVLDAPASLRGEGPVAGFELQLARVWDPLAD